MPASQSVSGLCEEKTTTDAVAAWARNAPDTATRLLVAAHPRGGQLQASYSPSDASCITYEFPLKATEVADRAERLVLDGLLARSFFDRLFFCSSCSSHRVHAREECVSCRSADLADIRILHHLRCAYQGPASDFQSGAALVCPKCSYELRHYGSDHETSGTTTKCMACGLFGSDPVAGFVCMDCRRHMDGTQLQARTYYHYSLTPLGITHICTDPSPIGFRLLSAGCPPELVRRAVTAERNGDDFTIIQVGYSTGDVSNEVLSLARGEYQNAIRTCLVKGDTHMPAEAIDFAFCSGRSQQDAEAKFLNALDRQRGRLRVPVIPSIKVYHRSDLLES